MGSTFSIPQGVPAVKAALPATVTLITVAQGSTPGARIMRSEALAAVAFNQEPPREPKPGTTLTSAIGWLIQKGYEPERKTPSGMAVWREERGEHWGQVRRQCTFVQEVQP